MFSLYSLKPGFQSLLRPLVAKLASAGITANQVTVATGAASGALGAVIAWRHSCWILLPPFLLVRMALNAIDGMLAREHNQQSKLGAILNELVDVVSDAALTFPLATQPGWNSLTVAGAIFAAALTEMAGILGLTTSGKRRYDGPFGKSDRALALGAISTWLALGWPVNTLGRETVLWVWILLCIATIVQRTRRALG
jgi:CDP-diacylglycerol--glycerol-3-phosphate 3-phosphatidyltransferase